MYPIVWRLRAARCNHTITGRVHFKLYYCDLFTNCDFLISHCTEVSHQPKRCHRHMHTYQVLGVEQVSVDAKEGGNDYCIYLGVEQVYYT